MDASALADIHLAALARLDEQSAALREREEAAQRLVVKCAEERAQLEREHSALVLAHEVYQRVIKAEVATPPAVEDDQSSPRLRARIGPQRYRILVALREEPGQNYIGVTMKTRLNAKRVKDQIVSDQSIGVLAQLGDGYHLTPLGVDLLDRFESYKASRGETLPAVNDPISEDEGGDTEGEEPDDRERSLIRGGALK